MSSEKRNYCPGDDNEHECPVGTYSDSGAASCINCAAGEYSSSGSSSCSTCSAGTYSSAASSSCSLCSAGYYSSSGASTCIACDYGMHSSSGASSCYSICGEGMVSSNEACDDGNTKNGDGCSNLCNIEPGFYCNQSPPTSPSVCNTICGDNKRAGTEACDDGNTQSGDGCSSTCTVETGYSCTGGTPTSADTCVIVCGDGIIISPETCDDCNTVSDDGCSSTCTIETGINCTRVGSNACQNCGAICGDSKKVTRYEQCEDGNTVNGDGCDSSCHIENGYYCSGGTLIRVDTCIPVCGDGKKLPIEECDDKNLNNGDGCSSTCKIEYGFYCTGGSMTQVDVCKEICGDGVVIGDTQTNCDDGNFINGDGCSSTCLIEDGWSCSGGTPTTPDICKNLCGDGMVTVGIEECDDKNLFDGDGCSSYCKIERGYGCINNYQSLIGSVCYELCGDGINIGVNPCDDGNTKNGDGCSSTCSIESGFTCSGGTPTKRDTCTEICGDSKYYGGNECDDGNLINGDGCSSTCELEKCYQCVGGSPTSKDTCSSLCITPNITSISTDNTITISFSHAMNQTSITLKDLQVTIDSYYTIDYSWNTTYMDSQTLLLSVDSKTVLEGGEKITIKFVNYKVFRAPRGGCLTVQELSTNLNSNLISSINTASSLSWFAKYTAYLGIVVTLVLLVVGGGSMEMLWSLLNTMQIISYLPLLTSFFPEHVRIMYLILRFSNLNFDFLSQIFKKMIFYRMESTISFNRILYKNGLDSSLILSNCASILLTLIINIILFLLAIIFNTICCFSACKKCCILIINMFLFNYFLRFMTEGYLEICFGSFLNLYVFKHSTGIEIASLIVSFIFAFFYILFPFLCFALIYDNRKEIAEGNETYIKRYGTMYDELIHDKGWECMQFYPVFLIRRLIYVILLIVLQGYSEIQCHIFILSSFLMLIYCFFARPFKEQINNILIIVNEVALYLISNLQLIFTTRSKERVTIDYTGWVMISIICINVMINIIICIIYNIRRKVKKILENWNKAKIQNQVFVLNENNLNQPQSLTNEERSQTILESPYISEMSNNCMVHQDEEEKIAPVKTHLAKKSKNLANFSKIVDKNYQSQFRKKSKLPTVQ